MDEVNVSFNNNTLEQFTREEAAYDNLEMRSVNQDTYDCLKTETEVKSKTSRMDKPDYKKFIIIVLSIVVIGFVVAVVSVTALVYAVVKETATDGDWTNWGDWGLCSVSCGGGLSTRARTCTNPRPKFFGLYCDGVSEQVKICNNVPCSNGLWTSWGEWGSCSSTCDGGLSTRNRTCTYPSSSLWLGQYCNGSLEQVKICNNIPCSDGVWTSWANWGSCSVTCGFGLSARTRTCTNPSPSLLGRDCNGSSEEVKICDSTPCLGSNDTREIIFSTREPKTASPVGGETLVFEIIITNKGSGYDNTTGIFTAPVRGVFMFSFQLCLFNGNEIFFEIVRENIPLLKGLISDPSYRNDGCHTASVPAFLTAGERVWVKTVSTEENHGIGLWKSNSDYWNMFCGVLIH